MAPAQVGNFLEYVEGALTAYLRLSEEAEALPSEDHRAVKDAQRRYWCAPTLSNAFGSCEP